MDVRLEEMKVRVRGREQQWLRRPMAPDVRDVRSEAGSTERLSWPRRIARQMCLMCEAETPVIGADQRIVFTRTVPQPPHVPSGEELLALANGLISLA